MKWFIKRNVFSFQSMLTVERDLANLPIEKPHFPTIIDDMEIFPNRLKEITSDDERKIQDAISRMDIKPTFDVHEAKRRLNRGFYFVNIEHNNKIVGWTWTGINKVYFEEFNCNLKVRKNQAFGFNAYIEREYRNRRLFNILRYERDYHLKTDGYEKLWGLIHKNNYAQIKSCQRMNYEFIGNFTFVKFLFISCKFPPRGI